uniref:Myosin N-terminal SH3-like domain-containing protein n=1 Tax=Caenorhabditis tropicalis TaxID=1561998 RepID=A0A1I7U354_9PELO
MLGQIKATVNKKVNKIGGDSSKVNPPSSPETPKKNRNRRKGARKGKEPSSEGGQKRKGKEESENSSTEENEASSKKVKKKKSVRGWIGGDVEKVVNLFDKEKHPPGQAFDNKPDPKNCAQKILQSERPDLFLSLNPTDLAQEEFQLLDEHLLRQGELRVDSTFTLGKVVDMDSKLKVGSGDEMEVLMLWSYGRFGAIYMVVKENDNEQYHL